MSRNWPYDHPTRKIEFNRWFCGSNKEGRNVVHHDIHVFVIKTSWTMIGQIENQSSFSAIYRYNTISHTKLVYSVYIVCVVVCVTFMFQFHHILHFYDKIYIYRDLDQIPAKPDNPQKMYVRCVYTNKWKSYSKQTHKLLSAKIWFGRIRIYMNRIRSPPFTVDYTVARKTWTHDAYIYALTVYHKTRIAATCGGRSDRAYA